MFNKTIHGTVLVSEVADRLFSNIAATGSLDQSFLATLKALLRKRLPQNETMQLTCRRLYQSIQELESVSASHCFTWFLIFADKLELKHFHALQMMIPRYLPRLFVDSLLTANAENAFATRCASHLTEME